ncbi:DMT family transporter [Desulfovibrio piger]|uniref:DMT family transporter n=1 Tax=Desulfovibrio piger TaxID=901 RepID=UPI0026F12839|nr:DMT family transporter [Desulfovibrio piger]
MTTATSRYFALLALTAALWGAQPLLVKITMRELNPSTMTAVRYLLMSITFFALMRWRGLPLLPPLRLMPALLLMGITGVALNNIAQFTGLQLSTVSNATLIATTTPAVTALVALIFLRERLLPIELLGILLSVAGALFLVSKGQIDVLLHISFNKGDLLFFTAQLGWAVYSLTGFRVMRHLPPLTTLACMVYIV